MVITPFQGRKYFFQGAQPHTVAYIAALRQVQNGAQRRNGYVPGARNKRFEPGPDFARQGVGRPALCEFTRTVKQICEPLQGAEPHTVAHSLVISEIQIREHEASTLAKPLVVLVPTEKHSLEAFFAIFSDIAFVLVFFCIMTPRHL